ncbi:MAG: hypothetical protein SF002_01185 [Alphaproteobacteria bacterium]|nr:hypothetical protein [Alphaproteobacteria bacterium]
MLTLNAAATSAASLPSAAEDAGAVETTATYCFSVSARRDVGVLPRLVGFFAKRDLIPTRLHLADEGDDTLSIDLQLPALDQPLAHLIAANFRQIIGVQTVLVSAKT